MKIEKNKKTTSSILPRFNLLCMFFALVLFLMGGVTTWRQILGIISTAGVRLGIPVTERAALIIDGDTFEELGRTKDAGNPSYEAARLRLLDLRNGAGCRYLYTMVPVTGTRYQYVIDGSGEPGEKTFSPLGAEADVAGYGAAFFRTMEEGVSQFGNLNYRKERGWGISTYRPIRNSRGKVVGIIGCDFDAESICVMLRPRILRQALLPVFFMCAGVAVYAVLLNRMNRLALRLAELRGAAETASPKAIPHSSMPAASGADTLDGVSPAGAGGRRAEARRPETRQGSPAGGTLTAGASGAGDPGMAGMYIEGLDTRRGIAMTGGTPEGYWDVLGIYRRDAEERLKAMEAWENQGLAPEGIPAFTIQVHALKSASASIGAAALSAAAAELEAAGRREDREAIQKNLGTFRRSLGVTLDRIDEALFRRAALQSRAAPRNKAVGGAEDRAGDLAAPRSRAALRNKAVGGARDRAGDLAAPQNRDAPRSRAALQSRAAPRNRDAGGAEDRAGGLAAPRSRAAAPQAPGIPEHNEMRRLFLGLKAALEAENIEDIDRCIKDMEGLSLSGPLGKIYADISDKVLMSEFSAAIAVIDAWLEA